MPDSGRGRLTPSKRKFLRAAAILQLAQMSMISVPVPTTPRQFYPKRPIDIRSREFAGASTRIYLAGKIAKNDWRLRLTDNAKASMEEEALDRFIAIPVKARGYLWTGPYAVACDHGCFHGPSTHGAAANVWCSPEPETNRQARRNLVHSLNAERIERSTGVFAYIDELDCYGTLAEIGHAYGQRIPVGLCYGPRITVHERDHLWFVERYANWVYDAQQIEQAFGEFLGELGNLQDSRRW
jgi:hypothetical protein